LTIGLRLGHVDAEFPDIFLTEASEKSLNLCEWNQNCIACAT